MAMPVPDSIQREFNAFVSTIPEEGTPEWDQWLEDLYDMSAVTPPPETTAPPNTPKKKTKPVRPQTPYRPRSPLEAVPESDPHWLHKCLQDCSTQPTVNPVTQSVVEKAMALMDCAMEQDRLITVLQEENIQLKNS